MTQDEMILTLLRAVARSMVCETCGGNGFFSEPGEPIISLGTVIMTEQQVKCSCRTAIRDLLAPKGV